MLSRKAILWSVLAASFAAYCKWARVQVLKDPLLLEEMMAVEWRSRGQEPVLIFVGRVMFFLVAGAVTFNFGQALVAAVKRYRYRPIAVPPLQPLSEEERANQLVAQATDPSNPADQPQQQQQQQKRAALPQRQGSALTLDERRMRAMEALQRELDEKAAALKEQQRQEAEARAAKAATEAVEKAAKASQAAAAQQAAQQAAAAAQSAQWEQWEQAVTQQHAAGAAAAAAASSSSSGSTGLSPPQISLAAPVNAEQLAENRILRETQDAEYHASLQADTEKQRQQDQVAQLIAFKAALQEKLPPEAEAAAGDGLAIRVRLPDGTAAVRQFAASQSFADVLDWVYSLPRMPLHAPATWGLASSFPKRRLTAAEGLWAAGSYRPTDDLQEFCTVGSSLGYAHPVGGYEYAARDVFSVTVRPLVGDSVTVQVSERSSVHKLKQQVQQQLGVSPDKQRLIYAGQMLKDDLTMQHYKITSQHTLQLAVQVGDSSSTTSSRRSSGTGGTAPGEGAATNKSSDSGDSSEEGVLVVKDVAQLKQDVANGAAQLALYVIEC